MVDEPTERRQANRGYPFSNTKPDRSGKVKMETLEYFHSHPGGHSATDMLEDPVIGAKPTNDGGNTALRIRLMRYTRQGLLKRIWDMGEYRYDISEIGEKRLIHLWEHQGLLNPEGAHTLKEIDSAITRLEDVRSILERLERARYHRIALAEARFEAEQE